jgi:hypothetical protein
MSPPYCKSEIFKVIAPSCNLNIWMIFGFLWSLYVYDIHNKISKLDLFGQFSLWLLLASCRGHWKTLILELIQKWLVGRFDGFIKCLKHTQKEIEITNSFWVIPLSSKFLPTPRFWPQQRMYWGWAKTFEPDIMQWGLNNALMKFEIFLGCSFALYWEGYEHFESTFAPCSFFGLQTYLAESRVHIVTKAKKYHKIS